MTPTVYLHSSEKMPEIDDNAAKLIIGASVYLGKGVAWDDGYETLYRHVYCFEGQRILRKDGVLVIIQTNAYEKGQFVCRYHHIMKLMSAYGWALIDERVWQRRKADHFQVPFSHVLVFKPPDGTAKRNDMNERSKAWFQGVWDYPQGQGGALNSYPPELCKLIIQACTDPDDLIVDPFAGTGRLLGMAANSFQRRALGYEIDRDCIEAMRSNGCRVVTEDCTLGPQKPGFGL